MASLAQQVAGPEPTLALTRELLERRSLTPADAGCQALIADRLRPLGFRCESIVANGVTNLWARRGDAAPLVCFAGHTDVVPTGPLEAWTSDPFTPTERDGWLYGRGAADMKGSLAAFVTAIDSFLTDHPRATGSLGVVLTSDEEGPSVDGTVRVVERLAARGEHIDYCIVGEPSCVTHLGDMVKNGRRGTLSGTLVVKGVQGHIAYPQHTRNPIHLLAPALTELARLQWDEGSAHFQPTTWQCSNIHSGTGATNVVPGTLELMFNFRYSTASTRESLAATLESVLQRHGLDYDLVWTGHGKPFLTATGRLLEAARAAILAETGLVAELSTSGGTSDGRFLADIASEVLEFGPVGATIHKIDERVKVADLAVLARIYRRTLDALLGP